MALVEIDDVTVDRAMLDRAGRGAIQALREPTDAMLLAFVKRQWGDQWEFAWNNQEREHCKTTWQAVIDIIISGAPGL